ncbi:MAG: hypothetical protein ABSD67_20560 [Terracidiphilus sp.]
MQKISAYSPQARGRSKRNFSTRQGRLPQELRLRQIRTVKAVNKFLNDHYIAEFNRRFTVPAAQWDSACSDPLVGTSHRSPRAPCTPPCFAPLQLLAREGLRSGTVERVGRRVVAERGTVEQRSIAPVIDGAIGRHIRQDAFFLAGFGLFAVGLTCVGDNIQRSRIANCLLRCLGHRQQLPLPWGGKPAPDHGVIRGEIHLLAWDRRSELCPMALQDRAVSSFPIPALSRGSEDSWVGSQLPFFFAEVRRMPAPRKNAQ